MAIRGRNLLPAVVSSACALLLGSYALQISRDFVAAGLTAVFVNLAFTGALLCFVAVGLSLIRPRLGAAAALLAAITGLPLLVNFAMPLLFRRLAYGENAGTTWYWYLAGSPRAFLVLLVLVANAALAARELIPASRSGTR